MKVNVQLKLAYPDVKSAGTSIYQAATASFAITVLHYCTTAYALYFELRRIIIKFRQASGHFVQTIYKSNMWHCVAVNAV